MDLSDRWSYIVSVAEERLCINKTKRHVSYGAEKEIIGAAAELAAHRLFGISEALHIGFDKGIDFIHRGISFDVKGTELVPTIKFRCLQFPVSKKVKADIIILFGIDLQERSAVPLGYSTRERLLATTVNYERPFPCYEIPIPELDKIKYLSATQ